MLPSKPRKNSKENKKAKSNGLFFVKALFALTTVSALILIIYVITVANKNGFIDSDLIPVSGENKADDPAKIAAMESTLNVDTIYENIFIENIDVSRLTKTQAINLLKKKFNTIDDNEITIQYGKEKTVESFSNFQAQYNIAEAVDEAYNYGRNGTLSERFQKVLAIKNNALKLKLVYSCDVSQLSEIVNNYAQRFDIAPKEPEFSRVDGEFIAKPGAAGISIDKEKLADDIKRVLNSKKSGTVEVVSNVVNPKYKAEEFAKATNLLGSFTTYFVEGVNNRNQNIITAASKINNSVVLPGEVFSTNKEFGETTYENGYRVAGTYLNGKIVDGMGGGMCQVSTTLYMALLHAEAEIVERANHSMKVGYANYGFDATLAGDYIDLKFKNNTDYPMTIESVLTNKGITVNIYGFETRDATRKLKFESVLVSETQPGAEIIKKDPTLPLDKRVVDVAQKTGYKYQLYKIVYENGIEISRSPVNTSTYRAIQGEVRIGTGPPEEIPAQPTPEPIVQTPPDVMDPFPDPTFDGPLMP